MSKSDLKSYYSWFFEVLPDRIEELRRAVNSPTGFQTWQPDCSAESLDLLGEWFAQKVEIRPRSSNEFHEIVSASPYPIEISTQELTNLTFSLAFDIGIYISQVFVRHFPQLEWDQRFGSKNFIDYGQPILTGFGRVPFNPVRMVVTLAYGLASKKDGPRGLHELYEIWANLIPKTN